jgi:hypothetical protein
LRTGLIISVMKPVIFSIVRMSDAVPFAVFGATAMKKFGKPSTAAPRYASGAPRSAHTSCSETASRPAR